MDKHRNIVNGTIIVKDSELIREALGCYISEHDGSPSFKNRVTVMKDLLRIMEEPFVRAGGDTVCEECGNPFSKHVLDLYTLDKNGEPYLNVLCNGVRVKL